MAAVNIRDSGRNTARTTDVRDIADRVEETNPGQQVIEADVTVTTATIAVTDDTNTDVSFVQPAGTIIRNLIAIPAGNIVTGGSSGNDVDFSLGTAAGGGQIIATEAILDDGGSAVTWAAKTPLYLIKDSHGHGANAFVTTSVTAGVVGGPATSEAIVIASTLYSAAARTLHARLTPIGADLATAATTVKYIVQFEQLD
jgi:hypothetical protein|tara:strand:+ start:84 stop:680 length:597 start_codon:yes stop_codon:yes gene_type:complete